MRQQLTNYLSEVEAKMTILSEAIALTEEIMKKIDKHDRPDNYVSLLTISGSDSARLETLENVSERLRQIIFAKPE